MLCSRIASGFGDLYVDGVCELDPWDQKLARHLYEHAEVTGDFFAREWQLWASSPDVLFMLACGPCNPIADSGRREGLQSPDIYLTVAAIPEVVKYFKIPFFFGEQHAKFATFDDGAVLAKFDSNLEDANMTRVPRHPTNPYGVEGGRDFGHPEPRGRIGLHGERTGMHELIGPCPLLDLRAPRQLVIRDVLDPPELVPEYLFLDGQLQLLPIRYPLSRRAPTVAAILTMGGPDVPLFRGSRVLLVLDEYGHVLRDAVTFVLWRFTSATVVTLFLDSRACPEWLYDIATSRIQHIAFDIDVFHIDGVGGVRTSFGVPPLGPCKQAILVDGRPRLLTTREMYQYGGDLDGYNAYHDLGVSLRSKISEFTLRSKPGKSLQYNLARPGITRLRSRIHAYLDVLHGATPYRDAPQTFLAPFVKPITEAEAVIVFVSLANSSFARVLVGSDLASLPAVPCAEGADHRSVMHFVIRLTPAFANELGYTPEAFLAGSTPDSRHVIVCPIGTAEALDMPGASLRWASLDELGDTPCFRPAALALATSFTSKSDLESARPPTYTSPQPRRVVFARP